MTAPASIPALIAEGRRLIAAATKGPLHVDDDDGWAVRDRDDVLVAVHVRFVDAPLHVLAVNAFPALLDVAEAAAAYQEEMAALGNGVDPALSAALSALAPGPDDEGKEKSNG